VVGDAETPAQRVFAQAVDGQRHQHLAVQAQERHGVAGKQPAQRGQQAPVALALGQIERQVANDGKQRLQ
jgi:hypothetical protein